MLFGYTRLAALLLRQIAATLQFLNFFIPAHSD
jgi:hypothetical protein